MPPPLLLADTPHLLYRAFFAPARLDHRRRRPPGQRAARLGQPVAVVRRALRAARRGLLLRPGVGDLPHRALPALPRAPARRCRTALADQWERAPALYEALGWTVARPDELEADDLMYALAPAEEAAAGGRALILTGDRDMFQCASDDVTSCCSARARRARTRSAPPRCEERYGIAPGASCRTSSRCAATRRTGCRARRGSARRRPPTCCAATAASRRRSRGAIREKPAGAPRAARAGRRAAGVQGHRARCATRAGGAARRTGRPTAPAAPRRRGRSAWAGWPSGSRPDRLSPGLESAPSAGGPARAGRSRRDPVPVNASAASEQQATVEPAARTTIIEPGASSMRPTSSSRPSSSISGPMGERCAPGVRVSSSIDGTMAKAVPGRALQRRRDWFESAGDRGGPGTPVSSGNDSITGEMYGHRDRQPDAGLSTYVTPNIGQVRRRQGGSSTGPTRGCVSSYAVGASDIRSSSPRRRTRA